MKISKYSKVGNAININGDDIQLIQLTEYELNRPLEDVEKNLLKEEKDKKVLSNNIFSILYTKKGSEKPFLIKNLTSLMSLFNIQDPSLIINRLSAIQYGLIIFDVLEESDDKERNILQDDFYIALREDILGEEECNTGTPAVSVLSGLIDNCFIQYNNEHQQKAIDEISDIISSIKFFVVGGNLTHYSVSALNNLFDQVKDRLLIQPVEK